MNLNSITSGRRRRTIVHQTSSTSRRTRRAAASGFTLVEMLVSVALVLLMMTMFAQIFQMATGSLSQQKAIAENDQKARMLTTILRGDLEHRTFRDVFPFRSGEDTRQLGHSLSRRSGYVEIDEGDPLNDTDDVLQFTALVNIKLQNSDSTPFTGKATAISAIPITGYPSNSSITVAGNYAGLIPQNSHIWIVGSSGNDGRYNVIGTSGTTTITLATGGLNTAPAQPGNAYISEYEPDFDDGVFGNGSTVSSAAEICYFLRNGTLYRRVLLIRDPAVGGDAQPTYGNGMPLLWNGAAENYPPTGNATSFWRDFDYSAFYFNGKSTASGTMAPGVRFHSATESLSNSSQAPQIITVDVPAGSLSFPVSLGIPNFRFAHSLSSGLTQDASTAATTTTGQSVIVNRYTLQECSNSAFGYPGYIAGDPYTGNPTSPFDRTNIQVDPNSGQVVEYSTQTFRRGEDILMPNVLTFDVKVWDPFLGGFVDVGDSTVNPGGPFSSAAALNTFYGGTPGHFRFDTWHPLASVGPGPNPSSPPYLPVDGNGNRFPLMAIQITINYRDVSSGQVRQTTIVQSLVDRVKPQAVTDEAPEE
jgi:type II secretory pathway pseudopilin PulG